MTEDVDTVRKEVFLCRSVRAVEEVDVEAVDSAAADGDGVLGVTRSEVGSLGAEKGGNCVCHQRRHRQASPW